MGRSFFRIYLYIFLKILDNNSRHFNFILRVVDYNRIRLKERKDKMLFEKIKKKKTDAKYILTVTMDKPYAEDAIDSYLKHEAHFSNFLCRKDDQLKTVLTYEVLPKTVNTEFVHSLLAINSVVMVSINKKNT